MFLVGKSLHKSTSESSWKMKLKDVYFGAKKFEAHIAFFVISISHELSEDPRMKYLVYLDLLEVLGVFKSRSSGLPLLYIAFKK